MKGLILKDFISMKTFVKHFTVMGIAFSVLGFAMKAPSYIATLLVLFGAMSVITSMSLDEKANWYKLALSMPLTAKEIICSKYITWFLMSGISMIAALLIGGSLAVMLQQNLWEYVIELASISVLFTAMFSAVIPLLFWFGVEKGRLAMILILMISTLLIVWGSGFLEKTALSDQKMNLLLVIGAVILVVAAPVLSWLVSVRIMKKKEW